MGLRWAPPLTLAVMLGPILAGLIGVAAPAFGWLPALGGEEPSLQPFADLFATPGLDGMIALSIGPGLLATALSLIIVTVFCAGWSGARSFMRMRRLLSPLLAAPHVAIAFGLAFLIAPSGWAMRLISPELSGFARPPDWPVPQDPWGLSLTLGLMVKEVPFLLLMTIAAMGQVEEARSRAAVAGLGYGRIVGWLKAIFPRIYPQIRLPVFAVLAFSMSVVDVALVLGPTTPPPLAVQIVKWMNDPELSLRFQAAAGALLQLALVGFAIGLWMVGERLVGAIGRRWAVNGRRGRREAPARAAALSAAALAAAIAGSSLIAMAVWSFAGLWRFPHALPASWSLRTWMAQADGLLWPAVITLIVGMAATAAAIALSLACLEHEAQQGRKPGDRGLWLLYAPLLTPQIAFLFGLQALMVAGGVDATWGALIWTHLVFVLPYVFLALADPYRAWDPRYGRCAHALGANPWRMWWRIKAPMLLRPLLAAAAVGFAVSVGQYLPTLLIGAGRLPTLTTEAVALSAGADRRIIGVYAVAVAIAPAIGFAAALGAPALLFRRRAGMRAG